MIIPASLSIVFTGFVYVYYLEPSMKGIIIDEIHNVSLAVGDEIDQIIEQSINNTQQLSTSHVFSDSNITRVDYEKELRNTRDFYGIFKDITLLDMNGNILASVDYSFRGQIEQTQWFKDALEGQIVISDLHALLYPYEIVVTTLCPIINDEAMIDKIIVAQLNVQKIWDSITRTARRTNSEIWILDSSGIIIYSPNEEQILERYPSPWNFDDGSGTWSFNWENDQTDETHIVTAFPDNLGNFTPQWYILSKYSSDVLFLSLHIFRNAIYINGLFNLFMVTLLSLILSKNISFRIRKIRDATVQLGKGNYDVKIEDIGRDEVGDLAKNFKETQHKLHETQNLLIKANERYEVAVNGANDAIWDWDLKKGSIYLAPKWFEIIGRGTESPLMTFDQWIESVHFEDRERIKMKLQNHKLQDNVNFKIEYRIIRSDGKIRWIMTRGTTIYEEGIKIRMAGSHSDITERKKLQQEMTFYAHYDGLTKLPNRVLLSNRIKQSFQRCERTKGYSFTILFLDFDGFKHINDTYGHLAGDLMLISISERLKECVRPLDMVSRIGGDEFIILLDGISDENPISIVVDRIMKSIKDEFMIESHSIFINVSIGVATNQLSSTDPDDIIQKADIAMYYSKLHGKGKSTFFTKELQSKEVSRWSLENELHKALGTDQLQVYYQPIVDAITGNIYSFEALLRWRHPQRGLISPTEFIPSAEETGFISNITHWLIEQVCIQSALWNGVAKERITKISFNVTAKDFLINGGLDELIKRNIEKYAIAPQWLALEVTESTMIQNFNTVMEQVKNIRNLGVSIELDDFGTGYSSLSYLNKFELDYIKIDQSFVMSMLSDPMSFKIVKTVINLAHELGLKIIAEGVETDREIKHLKEWNCQFFQGYYFSKPITKEQAHHILDNSLYPPMAN